jgi:hypothetical protein
MSALTCHILTGSSLSAMERSSACPTTSSRMATWSLTRTWSCIIHPGYRQLLLSVSATAARSSLNGMARLLSIDTFTLKYPPSFPCGGEIFWRKGGPKRGRSIRMYNDNKGECLFHLSKRHEPRSKVWARVFFAGGSQWNNRQDARSAAGF